MTKYSSIGARMKIAAVLPLAIFIYLGIHLYNVQIERHDELYTKAKSKYTCVVTKSGKRGEIYDFDGNLLVGNVPCSTICADPTEVGSPDDARAIASFFASALKTDAAPIMKRLMSKTITVTQSDGSKRAVPRRFVVIERNVDYDLSERLKLEVEKRKFNGVFFRESTMRQYPKGKLLSNILGFTNIDCDQAVAVIGIEKFFDKPMKSSKSVSEFERSRDGNPLGYGNANINEVKDGLNIYLTIKEPVQAILEEELDKLMEKYSPKAAYAIMANPYTGDIIAVAQRPSFNPNNRDEMNPECWRNRIAEDIFEPGSTMKPFAISGALDCGVVTPATKFDCEKGHWFYAGKTLRDSHPLGILTVSEVIQKSSNIGTAKIAILMGEGRLDATLRSFGFGSRTGVPLKPETAGIFRPVERWDALSISRFPIGQGIAVSPLQLVRAYCILANGGSPVKLRLVDRIENPASGIVKEMPVDKPKYNVFRDKSTHSKIVKMMERVTQDGGTATAAAVPGFNVAGKTGTSQKAVAGGYSGSQFFATFVGFVPAERPQFVLLVTADEPKNCHYGGTVSAPYFRSIAERTLKYMNVMPDFDPEEKDGRKVASSAARGH